MVDLRAAIEQLGQRGVQGVLCEPGPKIAAALLEQDLVDRLIVYRSADTLGPGSLVFPKEIFSSWSGRAVERLNRRIGRDSVAVYDRGAAG